MADTEELIERMNRLTPVSWTNEPDPSTGEPMYANMQFGEHQTQAMSMRPDDWMALNDIATALSAQQREIAELREALAPFALLADGANMNDPLSKWFTIAHLQAAGAALNTPSQEGEKR